MKLNKMTMIAALALGGLLALGSTVNAQDTASTNAPAPAAPGRGRQLTIEQWTKLLALTDDQKTNFQAAMQDTRKQMMAVRSDDSLSDDDKRAKTKTIREASLAKIKGILTADQFAKYQKAMPGRRPAAAAPAPAN